MKNEFNAGMRDLRFGLWIGIGLSFGVCIGDFVAGAIQGVGQKLVLAILGV